MIVLIELRLANLRANVKKKMPGKVQRFTDERVHK